MMANQHHRSLSSSMRLDSLLIAIYGTMKTPGCSYKLPEGYEKAASRSRPVITF